VGREERGYDLGKEGEGKKVPLAGRHEELVLKAEVLLLILSATMLSASIMISAWYGGLGPGLLATAMSALISNYHFVYPKHSFAGVGVETTPLIAFVLEGIFVSSLAVALRFARSRAEESASEARSLEELQTEGFEASYEDTLGEERLPSTLEVNLFRVAQEALSNVRKHAKTDRVCVAIGCQEGVVRLKVRDWGRGFRPSGVRGSAGQGETVGLSSMRDRVALLNGNLQIRSEPGLGTSVVAEIPLSAAGEEEEADDEG
jgi:K+-sensing histidine kinase KdpD